MCQNIDVERLLDHMVRSFEEGLSWYQSGIVDKQSYLESKIRKLKRYCCANPVWLAAFRKRFRIAQIWFRSYRFFRMRILFEFRTNVTSYTNGYINNPRVHHPVYVATPFLRLSNEEFLRFRNAFLTWLVLEIFFDKGFLKKIINVTIIMSDVSHWINKKNEFGYYCAKCHFELI